MDGQEMKRGGEAIDTKLWELGGQGRLPEWFLQWMNPYYYPRVVLQGSIWQERRRQLSQQH